MITAPLLLSSGYCSDLASSTLTCTLCFILTLTVVWCPIFSMFHQRPKCLPRFAAPSLQNIWTLVSKVMSEKPPEQILLEIFAVLVSRGENHPGTRPSIMG